MLIRFVHNVFLRWLDRPQLWDKDSQEYKRLTLTQKTRLFDELADSMPGDVEGDYSNIIEKTI